MKRHSVLLVLALMSLFARSAPSATLMISPRSILVSVWFSYR